MSTVYIYRYNLSYGVIPVTLKPTKTAMYKLIMQPINPQPSLHAATHFHPLPRSHGFSYLWRNFILRTHESGGKNDETIGFFNGFYQTSLGIFPFFNSIVF